MGLLGSSRKGRSGMFKVNLGGPQVGSLAAHNAIIALRGGFVSLGNGLS